MNMENIPPFHCVPELAMHVVYGAAVRYVKFSLYNSLRDPMKSLIKLRVSDLNTFKFLKFL